MTCTFNAAIRIEYIPQIPMEIVKVIMLLKVGKDPHTGASYRPIFLLSVICKVFEKLLHKKPLLTHPPHTLSDHQFGFRVIIQKQIGCTV